MFYEEKVIDGVLCWRDTPDGEWHQSTPQELTARIALLNTDLAEKDADHDAAMQQQEAELAVVVEAVQPILRDMKLAEQGIPPLDNQQALIRNMEQALATLPASARALLDELADLRRKVELAGEAVKDQSLSDGACRHAVATVVLPHEPPTADDIKWAQDCLKDVPKEAKHD